MSTAYKKYQFQQFFAILNCCSDFIVHEHPYKHYKYIILVHNITKETVKVRLSIEVAQAFPISISSEATQLIGKDGTYFIGFNTNYQ